jgi:thioredoxin
MNTSPKPSAPTRVLAVTDATFEREVIESDLPVFVDFWAPWCGPCRAIAPLVEQLAAEYEGRVKFVKLDTEANPRVPGAMRIRSIPTLLVFRGTEVVESQIGAGAPDALRRMLDRALGEKKPGFFARIFGG